MFSNVAGDWRSGSALRSHRRGHWFEPSITHRNEDALDLHTCRARASFVSPRVGHVSDIYFPFFALAMIPSDSRGGYAVPRTSHEQGSAV